jgi:hypothetical protein
MRAPRVSGSQVGTTTVATGPGPAPIDMQGRSKGLLVNS